MKSKIFKLSLLFLLTAFFTINIFGGTTAAEVKFDKASYVGLYSTASVSVKDQDLNLRPGYRDAAKVRITSGSDTTGFILPVYETGINTGVFSGSINFSTDATDRNKPAIKIKSTDNITATYIDEKTANNTTNMAIAATAGFQFAEATIQTSAVNDEGTGNMLEITINEPDANNPKTPDRIIARAGSGTRTDDLTLWLDETGTDTGSFKTRLFFNGNKTVLGSLQVAPSDKINIKYVDKTVPQGNIKEVIKTVKWTYQSSILKLDKAAYTGYNSTAKITLINMELNKDDKKTEYVDVKVSSLSSNSLNLKLKETSVNSGEFSGTLHFGKSTNRSEGIIKVADNDTILVSYTNKKDKDDIAESSAEWSPQDARITLDRQEYKGNNVPVTITVEDLDSANDTSKKDTVRVIARMEGSSKSVSVTLTETKNNSGIYTGILYINGSSGNKPSITLSPADKLEVTYTDRDTKSGRSENRTAYATWGGISEAKLTMDNAAYKGYDTYLTINLNDPDQNKSTTVRDKVDVLVKTKSGKTSREYTLTETDSNTGIFTARLKFTEEAPAYGRIRVEDSDEITVSFREKKASVSAVFER